MGTALLSLPLREQQQTRQALRESRSVDDSEDTREYVVVLNGEEQYSIWLAYKPVPAGWRAEGTRGSKADCLAHIEAVWTDLRPLSLRRAMDRVGAGHGTGQ
jgi:MbtH protein